MTRGGGVAKTAVPAESGLAHLYQGCRTAATAATAATGRWSGRSGDLVRPLAQVVGHHDIGVEVVFSRQIAAFGGLVYPLLRGFVAPDLLGFEVSTKAVVMSLVGGVGTLLGPLAGSAIITFLESFVGSYTERHLMVLGVIFIVLVIFLPDGLCGLAQRAFRSRRKALP